MSDEYRLSAETFLLADVSHKHIADKGRPLT